MSHFRLAVEADLPQIMEIVRQAQAFLAAQHIDQWQDGYPDEAMMLKDMRLGRGHVLEEKNQILGIASLVLDGEPTYRTIYDGAWHTPESYACIHRIAVSMACRGKGTADVLMQAAEEAARKAGIPAMRIDTHHDNQVMQRMLRRNGYAPCGTIYLRNKDGSRGAARIALDKLL